MCIRDSALGMLGVSTYRKRRGDDSDGESVLTEFANFDM